MTPVARFRSATQRARSGPGRAVLGLVGTALVSARRRAPVRVVDCGDMWAHHHEDGVLFFPAVTATSPTALEVVTRDTFLYDTHLRPGDVILDIGAAVGEQALTFSKLVGPSGKVLSVEAHPRIFACLQAAIRANGLYNVQALQLAIAGEPGVLRLSDDDAFLGNTVGGTGTVEVPAQTLDALVVEQGLDRVDLLKLNIEGAEVMALEGMQEQLGIVRNIVVSCHDFKAERTGNPFFRTRERVEAQLRAAGFEVRRRPKDVRPWVRDTLYGTRPL